MKEFTPEELKNEQWKKIEFHEELYQVSSLGRIKSCQRQKERILEQYSNNYGETVVMLTDGENLHGIIVGKEVAKAFVPNPNGCRYIRYKDSDKRNCRASNLEWCEMTDRMREKYQNTKSINQYDADGKYLMTWDSAEQIADYFHIGRNTVYSACYKTAALTCGSYFRYEEDVPAGEDICVGMKSSTAGVKQYTKDGTFVKEYSSTSEAARELGGKATEANICACCKGNRASAYGYVWKYSYQRKD